MWVSRRRDDHWQPGQFLRGARRESLAEAVFGGHAFLALDREGQAVATFSLERADPSSWPETEADAARYLHGFGVRRRASGLGASLLIWAAERSRSDGADHLRLDCWANNEQLRAYYERQGFRSRGEIFTRGRLFARYEMRLSAMDEPDGEWDRSAAAQ